MIIGTQIEITSPMKIYGVTSEEGGNNVLQTSIKRIGTAAPTEAVLKIVTGGGGASSIFTATVENKWGEFNWGEDVWATIR